MAESEKTSPEATDGETPQQGSPAHYCQGVGYYCAGTGQTSTGGSPWLICREYAGRGRVRVNAKTPARAIPPGPCLPRFNRRGPPSTQ